MSQTDTLEAKIDQLLDLMASIGDHRNTEPLARVEALRVIAETATNALPQAVDAARAADWSWTALGRALGTTRQSAWERYSGS